MILSDEERAKFCQWLECNIASSLGILEQFKKLSFGVDELVRREKIEFAASKVILAKLQSMESQTVRGSFTVITSRDGGPFQKEM